MNYQESVNYIHSFTRFGSQLGLERMAKLLELMGNPHEKLKFVHIAGTNGKGSTAQFSTQILRNAGLKVGTYISPFVVDFRERFQINNEMIAEEEFRCLVEMIDPIVKQMSKQGMQVTEFEAITAIAMQFFCQNQCDIVCLEVGLGGRFDATNVIDTPEVAIITSISLDHVDILGDTIEKIASEKAGIIKEKTDVVTYPLQEVDAVAVFLERCALTQSTLILPNANAVTIIKSNIFGSEFIYDKEAYSIQLAGTHQIYNAVAVIEAMKILQRKGYPITLECIKKGLQLTTFPARFERMSEKPLIIVDGAHNKQAVLSLVETLDKLQVNKKIAIVGMMKDKDYQSAVEQIGSRCEWIITVPVNNPRAVDFVALAEVAKQYCNQVEPIDDYDKALQKALTFTDDNSAIIVCGSFYMASDMRKTINNWTRYQ
ncbi:folylpolyglutamate synthase/dihydrofolate synthase family protein [Paludicola sp. MB14-C6]|uniref:bifunctional folylpolyglutamate synthase/dihydrofolate synthase n=1 Tax=Paludihabitans sp. MB14-C6 TaxID=3070656 RepID=UPI0027DE93DA|nr:folylpolyglutamate synthase/dihydrofolate synthase family protein [Paludicola sp. MB14-C6]WMJ23995.1 folylpolyglutamate synthase/dihydrofolate synthase family protein [Paludicola sp. MB14-C6]